MATGMATTTTRITSSTMPSASSSPAASGSTAANGSQVRASRSSSSSRVMRPVSVDPSDCSSPTNSDQAKSGGDLKVVSQKLEWKVNSLVGSLDNVKHRAGGGQVQIFDEKYNRSSRSSSQVRSQTPASGGQGRDGDVSSASNPQQGDGQTSLPSNGQSNSSAKPALPPKPAVRKASNGSPTTNTTSNNNTSKT